MGFVSDFIGDIFGRPDTPDYAGAARETAASDLAAAKYATEANRYDVNTPYGRFDWSKNPDGTWQLDQRLSSAEQQKLDWNNELALNQLGIADKLLGQAGDSLGKQIDTSGMQKIRGFDPYDAAPQYGNVGQVGYTGQDPLEGMAVQDAILSRLSPQIARDDESLRTRLANQGLNEGTAAWDNAMQQQGQKVNDLYTNAALQGIGAAQQNRQMELDASKTNAANYLAQRGQDLNSDANYQGNMLAGRGQDMQVRTQQYGEAAQQQSRPLDLLNALRSGAQTTNPTMHQGYNQAGTRGADYSAAAKNSFEGDAAQYKNNLKLFNAFF